MMGRAGGTPGRPAGADSARRAYRRALESIFNFVFNELVAPLRNR